MIKISIKSLWKGLVGINEKYYKQALEEGLALYLIFQGKDEEMFIPAEKVKKIHSKTKESFQDRFSKERYHLVYYVWKPKKLQESLF